MSYDFYAYMDRMKYIKRWQLMRSVREENIMEHSQQVTMLAHALAVINNKICGGNADPEKCVLYALYHECSEVLTGDLPTPIKYVNQNLQGAYKNLESDACNRLLDTLPKELQKELAPCILPDAQSYEHKIMKAADRLSAYIKCLEEERCGNTEFAKAKASILADLQSKNMPEVNYFLEHCMQGFSKTLDELTFD